MFTVFKKCLNPRATFTDEDVGKVNEFVFCRWLSGNPNTLQLAQFFNQYPNVPMKLKLQMVQKVVNGKIRYIPYPKQEKDINELINKISLYYNVNNNIAKLYLEFISKDEMCVIDEFVKMQEQ